MKNYTEFCNEQAEKLFQLIEQHDGLLQWKKTWNINGCMSLPMSVHGHYRGINLWKLLQQQIDRGLISNTWLTFNQIKEKGGHVLKGAKGTQVCFFKLREAEVDDLVEGDKQKTTALFRVYTVFNLDQTSLAGQGGDKTFSMPNKLQQLLSILSVTVSEFGNRAYYSPSDDVIVMPRREFFENEQDYDATLLHELVHFTGAPTRLDRECAKNYTSSDAARAEEELVAEIGSVFFTSYFGISGNLVNHASYVASWKKHLDSKAVGRAISQASKAFSWLVMQLEGQEVEAAA